MTFSSPAPEGKRAADRERGREGEKEASERESERGRERERERERVRERERCGERERRLAKETLMNADNKDPNLSCEPPETQRGFSLGQ